MYRQTGVRMYWSRTAPEVPQSTVSTGVPPHGECAAHCAPKRASCSLGHSTAAVPYTPFETIFSHSQKKGVRAAVLGLWRITHTCMLTSIPLTQKLNLVRQDV